MAQVFNKNIQKREIFYTKYLINENILLFRKSINNLISFESYICGALVIVLNLNTCMNRSTIALSLVIAWWPTIDLHWVTSGGIGKYMTARSTSIAAKLAIVRHTNRAQVGIVNLTIVVGVE